MKLKPDFSVVIPVYNGERFIAKAVRSALDQEHAPHEVIVVDDGSTDRTGEVLREFDGRIQYRRITNSGTPSRPRNVGIEMATGDYIAFLDADDFWFRRRLRVMAEYARKYPEAGLLASDYAMRDLGVVSRLVRHSSLISQREKLQFNAPMKADPLGLLLYENFAGTPSAVVVKKAALETSGLFDENCRMAEDLELYLRIALTQKFLVIDQILGFKHEHVNSLSFEKVRLYTGHMKVLADFGKSHRRTIAERDLSDVYRAAKSNLDYLLGHSCFDATRYKEAFLFYRDALFDDPTPRNITVCGWTMLKKTLRLAVGDRVNRKKLAASGIAFARKTK